MDTKICGACGIEKPISSFWRRGGSRSDLQSQCKECKNGYAAKHRAHLSKIQLDWAHRNGKCRPMSEAKESGVYLGIHIAERLLGNIFQNVKYAPRNTSGFDFICGKGYKIDVKSSCKDKHGMWAFHIEKNKIADYFLCLAFDNRESLNPEHLWLIPGYAINNFTHTGITEKRLYKWASFEQPLDKVRFCCAEMKEREMVEAVQ